MTRVFRQCYGSWRSVVLRSGLPTYAWLVVEKTGPGSVAGFGARIVAYLIDSAACALIAYGLLRDQQWTLVVFAVEVLVLTGLAGGSAGQLASGLRVVRLDAAGPVGLGRSALRTILLVLLIPALIWDRDGRGLHDRAVGTVVVRSR